MNKKIIALVVLAVVIIVLGIYAFTSEDDTSNETVEVTEETSGDLTTLQSNENIDDRINQLSEGMSIDEVHDIMGEDPTQSSELNSTEYDYYEKYEVDGDYVYDIYYKDDLLFGVSAVKK